MEYTHDSSVLIAQQFDSFEELAGIIVGWDADFRQLNAEDFKSGLFQAQIGSLLLSNAHFGCHVDQRGATPLGVRTFAVPDADCPEIRWFGHVTGPNVLLAFPMNGEVQAFSRPGFSVSTFSIPEALLEGFFERNGAPGLNKLLGSGEIIVSSTPQLLEGLRDQLRQLQSLVQSEAAPTFMRVLSEEFQTRLLFSLFEILTRVKPASKLSVADSQRTLGPIFDYLHAHPQRPLRMAELCAITQVSERTLQNHFKRELGMTPKAFLSGQRLHGVHRELWRADPSTTAITDVANQWGFWHMGQFAADYRRLFAELPSVTLKRSV
jgi:AraC family ethanolamine operon transcriptional activator